ncbi:MAG: hypothetical protein DDT39_00655 [Firmicutes bacterium]|nr:hypothetical protein [candidate division NPL-UPA2 bacterium]MBT9153990.1 hypothetical protein [candidate division NPL-UPA2 bacterium]
MNLVFFLVGVVTGGVVCYLYLQSSRPAGADEPLAFRVQALEEQLAALAAERTNAGSAPMRSPRARKGSTPTGKQERVLALYREGLECAQIAQATGVPLGQVELLTRLHGKE